MDKEMKECKLSEFGPSLEYKSLEEETDTVEEEDELELEIMNKKKFVDLMFEILTSSHISAETNSTIDIVELLKGSFSFSSDPAQRKMESLFIAIMNELWNNSNQNFGFSQIKTMLKDLISAFNNVNF